ncbi:hypothetical protein KOW79_003680 [Hemibagrus wyckioides]|uniref:Uncharacterized protein n=1 Tax=Hemibagrus wyckioides TaxID=337641 RepID=A0A9D3SSJ2_9TELE|nr:hypothetical protein KOW79_003680 [Hemibagrus wyckioides]
MSSPDNEGKAERYQNERLRPPDPSVLSMKSGTSMEFPLMFREPDVEKHDISSPSTVKLEAESQILVMADEEHHSSTRDAVQNVIHKFKLKYQIKFQMINEGIPIVRNLHLRVPSADIRKHKV